MDKRFLEECLGKGMSLEAIGGLAGKHPSTVSYWLRKYGLVAVGNGRHAPKGQVDPVRLKELVGEGASIREMAAELGPDIRRFDTGSIVWILRQIVCIGDGKAMPRGELATNGPI
ncbi:MAG TPA: hypothetical protein VNO20_01815 [Solirubrobacterales bacterium]|nr:hypothetical protein [Solirubrobacterales bacterium]